MENFLFGTLALAVLAGYFWFVRSYKKTGEAVGDSDKTPPISNNKADGQKTFGTTAQIAQATDTEAIKIESERVILTLQQSLGGIKSQLDAIEKKSDNTILSLQSRLTASDRVDVLQSLEDYICFTQGRTFLSTSKTTEMKLRKSPNTVLAKMLCNEFRYLAPTSEKFFFDTQLQTKKGADTGSFIDFEHYKRGMPREVDEINDIFGQTRSPMVNLHNAGVPPDHFFVYPGVAVRNRQEPTKWEVIEPIQVIFYLTKRTDNDN
jgi:hypothetical protein